MKSPELDPDPEIHEELTMPTRPAEKSASHRSASNHAEDNPASLPEFGPALSDLTSIADLTSAQAHGLLELAALVKARPGDFRTALAGKQIVLFFEKPSFRTRLTFESGVYALGGHAMFVDQLTSRIGEREPISDMAHNLERWVHALVLRTFSHETVTELARFGSIPVINALSDYEHPCQALADFLTLREKFGDLSQIRLAFVGDGNNVAHSLMLCTALFGGRITVGTPKGYEPRADVVAKARELASQTGATIELCNDPVQAVTGADAVYTDVWASMGQESETAERARIFTPFRVTPELFAHAAPGAVFMHCLPAHRGEEVESAVIDSPASVVFDQAENRLHIQKAILMQLLGADIRRAPARSL
jgi:ornithine carbamoyltransferase